MSTPTTIIRSPPWQTQHNFWQESLSSASLISSRLILVCGWRTRNQWKRLHSTSSLELLLTKYLQKVSADLCLLFSSFMREYSDTVVEAHQCAQYVDDIGIANNNATCLTRNIRAVFKCICQTGMKLTKEKCYFGGRPLSSLVGLFHQKKKFNASAKNSKESWKT